jgi:CubicO group peptidase (beta-lactamase class C family)
MQLILKHGKYGGQTYFNEAIMQEYTKAQFAGNRRGAGFDRPNASGGGTCDELASSLSFGHSGFTGTLAWADPKDEVVFIFLSNRVHPNQDNWKLRDLGIRTQLQHVVYEAVNSRKK